jgi:hypothetical protein
MPPDYAPAPPVDAASPDDSSNTREVEEEVPKGVGEGDASGGRAQLDEEATEVGEQQDAPQEPSEGEHPRILIAQLGDEGQGGEGQLEWGHATRARVSLARLLEPL